MGQRLRVHTWQSGHNTRYVPTRYVSVLNRMHTTSIHGLLQLRDVGIVLHYNTLDSDLLRSSAGTKPLSKTPVAHSVKSTALLPARHTKHHYYIRMNIGQAYIPYWHYQ